MTTKIFDSLGLKTKTLTAVKKLNYTSPMPVQAEVIPLILQGKDLLVSAPTGSGKTAAFTIPLFDILCRDAKARALIVAPTRELAQQILKVFNELAPDAHITTALIVGGKFMQEQLRKLKNKPRCIVGTPGRLNDHISRKSLKLEDFKHIVWDEMDRMLDLGFIHQIEHIIDNLPEEKQTLMFSATFPKRVEGLAQKYLKNPVRIVIDDVNAASKNVEQKAISTEGAKKPLELDALLQKLQGQIIVFTKTQKTADTVAKQAAQNGHQAKALHGGLRQNQRDAIVKAFRAGDFRVLVATDVAARGLDIPKISCVINYELPQAPEEYIHRIGRTGRVKEKGTAISLIGKADRGAWKEIQKFLEGSECAPAQDLLQKQDIIAAANKAAGPFPVKRENIISFKNPQKFNKAGKAAPVTQKKEYAAPFNKPAGKADKSKQASAPKKENTGSFKQSQNSKADRLKKNFFDLEVKSERHGQIHDAKNTGQKEQQTPKNPKAHKRENKKQRKQPAHWGKFIANKAKRSPKFRKGKKR